MSPAVNDAPRNETPVDLGVNCLEVSGINPKGETRTVSGVTAQPLNEHSIMAVMRAGRSRWTMDNDTCQTVKTTRGCGRAFAHHCGHDPKTLASVLPHRMMRCV